MPVQALRVSAMSGGVHSGAASVKRSRGQPTASKTTCQSTRGGGRTMLRRHPVELGQEALRVDVGQRHAFDAQRRIVIEGRVPSSIGTRGSGLVRYQ